MGWVGKDLKTHLIPNPAMGGDVCHGIKCSRGIIPCVYGSAADQTGDPHMRASTPKLKQSLQRNTDLILKSIP